MQEVTGSTPVFSTNTFITDSISVYYAYRSVIIGKSLPKKTIRYAKKLFQKPKISTGENWYIEWYELTDGVSWTRKRVTYGINRVKKLKDRKFLAQAVLEKVTRNLERASVQVDVDRNLFESIQIAVKSKLRDGRQTSNKVYLTAKNHFFSCGGPAFFQKVCRNDGFVRKMIKFVMRNLLI